MGHVYTRSKKFTFYLRNTLYRLLETESYLSTESHFPLLFSLFCKRDIKNLSVSLSSQRETGESLGKFNKAVETSSTPACIICVPLQPFLFFQTFTPVSIT